MTAALTVAAMLAICWLTHIVWWRIRLPENHTRGLLIVAMLVLAATVILAAATSAPALSLAEWLLVLTAYAPCCFTYVILYSLLESRSPTLDLVTVVDSYGTEGAPIADLRRDLIGRIALTGRLEHFESGGIIARSGDHLTMTPSGRRLGQLFIWLSRILAIRGGG